MKARFARLMLVFAMAAGLAAVLSVAAADAQQYPEPVADEDLLPAEVFNIPQF